VHNALLSRHGQRLCDGTGDLDAFLDGESDGLPAEHFLEVNPLPGLNPHSGDLPIMARLMGWTYEGLLNAILSAARSRYP
jgi:D-alanine-D-alanine ligase-like ATP-grasp enzyme